MPYTTVTTGKAFACQLKPQRPPLHLTHCGMRAAGTQPQPFTGSITYTSDTQLYFLILMTNNFKKQVNV